MFITYELVWSLQRIGMIITTNWYDHYIWIGMIITYELVWSLQRIGMIITYELVWSLQRIGMIISTNWYDHYIWIGMIITYELVWSLQRIGMIDLCHVLSSSTNNFTHAQTLSRMSSLSGRMNIARINIGFFTGFKKIQQRRTSFVLNYLRIN
jgi:hypothetical protein